MRGCVCVCKVTEGGLLVYMYMPLSLDEQKAADRGRDEMDEVGDVCVHAAFICGETFSGAPRMCVCRKDIVSVHLLRAIRHA